MLRGQEGLRQLLSSMLGIEEGSTGCGRRRWRWNYFDNSYSRVRSAIQQKICIQQNYTDDTFDFITWNLFDIVRLVRPLFGDSNSQTYRHGSKMIQGKPP